MSQSDLATERALAVVENQLKNLIPTPPIGINVWWYPNGRKIPGKEVAAIVVGIEAPGQIVVTTFAPNTMARHFSGVRHVSDPQHLNASNQQTVDKGSWDYINGKPAPKEHFELHKVALEKRRDGILTQHEREENARLNRELLKQQEAAANLAATK